MEEAQTSNNNTSRSAEFFLQQLRGKCLLEIRCQRAGWHVGDPARQLLVALSHFFIVAPRQKKIPACS